MVMRQLNLIIFAILLALSSCVMQQQSGSMRPSGPRTFGCRGGADWGMVGSRCKRAASGSSTLFMRKSLSQLGSKVWMSCRAG